MSNRKFNGVWIPKEIWLCEELTMLEKVILIEIDSLDNDEHCTASNEYLANFCQCSERKVSEAITKLCDLGYLETISFNGRVRVLKSNISLAVCSRQTSKICEADSQNLLPNNIYNNIENNNKTISKDIVEESSTKTNTNINYVRKTKVMDIISHNEDKSNKKGKNRFEQCLDTLDEYTNNDKLKESLITYLKFRLEVRDKPLYKNQWKGMLNKLDTLASDLDTQIKIVQYSLDKGYLSFYPVPSYNYTKQTQKKFIDDQVTVKNEEEEITHERF